MSNFLCNQGLFFYKRRNRPPSLVLSDQALPAGWDFSQFLFSYIL